MDKGSVLSGLLGSPRGSTLVGGEAPLSAVNSGRYVSPLTDGGAGVTSAPLHHAVHASLRSEVRTVALVGAEGSGKTTALEKLLLDWAKGEHLQGFAYVFHFRLGELTSLQGTLSLVELLLRHHGRIPPESMPRLVRSPRSALFVFDDLDRCDLDPSPNALCRDPRQEAPVAGLVASLLHGSLLKGASFVVASRPTGAVRALSCARLEVLGFLKPQRRAYFGGFFADPAAADKALRHMERTVGFHDVSTSPRFCWTVCSVYKRLMDAGAELPETLSQLCVDVLVQLIRTLSLAEASSRELVLALGKVASHCSLDRHSRCTKEEVDSCGLQRFLKSVDAFLRVDGEQSDTPAFSFRSRLMQDFLLALSFFLDKSPSEGAEKMLERHKGRAEFLDFFLSGLSEPGQAGPLETLLGAFSPDRITDFKRWFKSGSETALKGCSKEEHRRCFRLLHQAQNESLVREVITPSARVGISYGDPSLQDCVALSYVATCLGEMEQLNLYHTSNLTEDEAEMLAPAMSLSHKIILSDSSLSAGAVPHLASALSRGLAKDMDLSQTRLGDEKFKLLCAGLRDCKLQKLNLVVCRLTETSCEDLVSVLTSGTSQLCVIDMRGNQIGDQGLTKLCEALRSPHCRLQELLLQGCELTAASMEALSSAFCSGRSELRKLNLTLNAIGDKGVEALCESLQHPHCKLQSLIFFDCQLTGGCCAHLMRALMSEHCSVSELDLSVNDLGQEGALLLCRALRRPGCPLEKLGLKRCELTQAVFEELGSLLRSGTSQLKSLTVGLNKVGDRGVKHLWGAVAHPSCLLEELDVEMTGLTDACVQDLCAAIRASKTLKSLEMRNNSLTDVSAPALVQVMQDSHSMLEMNLRYNDFGEEAFDMLAADKIRY